MIELSTFHIKDAVNAISKEASVPEKFYASYSYEAQSVEDVFRCLRIIMRSLKHATKERLPDTLWFRGQTNRKYPLLPTLIRDYCKKTRDFSLPEFQRACMEQYLYSSRNAPELDQFKLLAGNAQIEYLAEMQHYSYPTNLLDWSENMLVPLYFACGGFRKHNREPENDATLFVLQPYLYNSVRKTIIKAYSSDHADSAEARNFDTTTHMDNVLPNLSAHFNIDNDAYQDFICGPDKWPLFPNSGGLVQSPLVTPSEHEKPPLLPLAVHVPHTSARIKAQFGTFVAYNLCAMPCKSEKDDERFLGFKYVDLEEIQKYYLREDAIPPVCSDHQNNKLPFLFRINLNKTMIQDANDTVIAMGTQIEEIYPELYRKGEHLLERMKIK